MKYILSIGIVLFFLFGFSVNMHAQNNLDAKKNSSSKTITVKVKGVGCSNDIKSIATSVKELSGVSACEVAKKGATTSYNVSYNPAMVTRQQIEDAVEGTPGCKNPKDRPYRVKN